MDNNSFSNAIIHFKWITEITFFRLALHSTELWELVGSHFVFERILYRALDMPVEN